MNIKIILLVLSTLTLSFSIDATAASNEVFEATPILMPDLRAKYDLLCGNHTSAQTLDLADLNGDGVKDILVGLWCGLDPGTISHEPVKAGLVAFIQNADHSFTDQTLELFGEELVTIEKTFENIVYDFNEDGYDDVFMTQSREDGRADPWDVRDNIKNAIAMSNGDGTYSILRTGCNDPCGTGYNAHKMDNEVGSIDVVTQPIGYGGTNEFWRYTNAWISVATFPIGRNGLVFFGGTDSNPASLTYSSASRVNGVPGVDLHTRSSYGDEWVKKDSLVTVADAIISTTWTSWNGDQGPIDVKLLDGEYYIGGSFEYGCEISDQSDSDLNLIYLQAGYKLDTYYDGMDIVEGRDMRWVYKLFGFSAKDGSLTSIPIKLQGNVDLEDNSYRISCEDINSDGRDDIVVATWGYDTHPHVYINTGADDFSLLRESFWPPMSEVLKNSQPVYGDVNGDGLPDIIYFSGASVRESVSNEIRYEIFLAKRHIEAKDLAVKDGSLDVDGNGQYDALTDGLLLLRDMFGLTDTALVSGAVAANADYRTAPALKKRIKALGALADIDGNGQIDALTDGLLTLRHLFGLEGDTLINGVVAQDATRDTAEEIEAHLEALMPAL